MIKISTNKVPVLFKWIFNNQSEGSHTFTISEKLCLKLQRHNDWKLCKWTFVSVIYDKIYDISHKEGMVYEHCYNLCVKWIDSIINR